VAFQGQIDALRKAERHHAEMSREEKSQHWARERHCRG
jgi:hypothetical protein